MKRRTFVQSAAVSVLGIGLSTNAIARPFLQTRSGVQHWLRCLVTATSAKRRSAPLTASTSFHELTTVLNAYFAKRGYEVDQPEYYFYHEQESCCFYSLKLQHTRAGLEDMLVAVVAHGPDGTWRHTHTLTGYQVEALARAADALTSHPALEHLLLPIVRKAGVPSHLGFSSALADVTFKTSLSKGKAATSITIHENGALLYQDTFESKHCLTFNTDNA